jgi:hypothetical protein
MAAAAEAEHANGQLNSRGRNPQSGEGSQDPMISACPNRLHPQSPLPRSGHRALTSGLFSSCRNSAHLDLVVRELRVGRKEGVGPWCDGGDVGGRGLASMIATSASALMATSTATASASFFMMRTDGASRAVPSVRPTPGRGALDL